MTKYEKQRKKWSTIFSVERFMNLTMPLSEKVEIANQKMGRYTVLVNRKHTLAHVIVKGDDMYVRVPIRAKKLHLEKDHVVTAYFAVRLNALLVGF